MQIIANIGINWFDESGIKESKQRAKNLISSSVNAGVKTICIPYFSASIFRDKEKQAETRKYELSPETLHEFIKVAQGDGLIVYVSPRRAKDIAYLDNIDVDGYHVSNGDLLYKPLLEELSRVNKPILVSTAFSTNAEIRECVEIIDNDNVTLLHSTGGMPTDAIDANLLRILELALEFENTPVGFESFLRFFLLDYVSMAFKPVVIMRRIDLDDALGMETTYSIAPQQLADLVKMAAAMDEINNPQFDEHGFTYTDFQARHRLWRCEESDYLLPPSE